MTGAVFLTGASTGIGRATALGLARRGVFVYAGVRRAQDADALVRDGGTNLRPLLLDVTDLRTIEAARDAIAAEPGVALRGIVNNAGIAIAGPIELLSTQDLQRQFDVNFFAPLAIARTFLPLLRATRGRIVNVSSIGGKLAAPFVGAYAASKFALEAATDALRVELRSAGVRVVLVEPGAVKTPIWSRSSDESAARFAAAPPDLRAAYDGMVQRMLRVSARMDELGIAPERVARAIEHALFAANPRARYLIGRDARLRLIVARLPDGVRDALLARMVGARRPSRAS